MARDRSGAPASAAAVAEHRARSRRELRGPGPCRARHARRPRAACPRTREAGTVTDWEPVDEKSSASPAASSSTAASYVIGARCVARHFGASLLAFLWPSSIGRLRRHDRGREAADILSFMDRTSIRSTCPRHAPTSSRTRTDAATLKAAKSIYDDVHLRRAWRRASSRSTRSACTSAAGCRGASRRSGSSARATARSTTVSARSATVLRRAASTVSPFDLSGGNVTINTGCSSVRRSAPTRPGSGRGSALRVSDCDFMNPMSLHLLATHGWTTR